MHELYLVAHLGGVLLKLVINWRLFGCYTRRETTSVFGNHKRVYGLKEDEIVELANKKREYDNVDN
ncbi:hypothetical protein C5S35_15610 [Candidatus Methanophagaceae archaeon]|nr:hypothetical protein C5S35_15610 [Methanophagales archaeon]